MLMSRLNPDYLHPGRNNKQKAIYFKKYFKKTCDCFKENMKYFYSFIKLILEVNLHYLYVSVDMHYITIYFKTLTYFFSCKNSRSL